MLWQEQDVTNSGLIIPEQALEELFFASIIAVGPGLIIDIDAKGEPIRKPMIVSPGENVVFSRFHGERVAISGIVYVVMSQDDVLSKIEIPKEELRRRFMPAGTSMMKNDKPPIISRITQ